MYDGDSEGALRGQVGRGRQVFIASCLVAGEVSCCQFQKSLTGFRE